MNSLSKRLKSITSFIEVDDSLVDVGCDHGLLSIYLVKNKLAKKVIASDINANALSSAIKNIKAEELDIPTILSDGLISVDLTGIDTLVISGMGTSTIKHILSDENKLKNIKKIVTQSNNDYEMLRAYMNSINYYLDNEVYVFDKGKWYVTSCFIKSDKKNSKSVIKYGLLNNDSYNNYLIEGKEEILGKIPETSSKAREKVIKDLEELKRAICK